MTQPGSESSWLDEWDHPPREGLLLQAAEPWPDKELMHLRINADTGCLHLLSLSFDSELIMAAGIECWRHCVPCCEYGLCPAFVSDS